ncbi:hypothetical protein [Pseudobacter ginsenosidimutans]|uniref:DUF4397 domain-containing protein n=1 Tax=Pseudobacter ginsenosidimutans TaxID=661488 RepID=A0A4V2F1L3_9BACT|nr:hypothetical protein [Pseudobacter ginsenosidimutans]QEC42829.1 hypothetical protein FSB84_14465 [Pseudobacter ginsenosidimutans]RZS74176.1 hypothetical protein EV199_0020 [Pseudobacter ginsenosidimutans]
MKHSILSKYFKTFCSLSLLITLLSFAMGGCKKQKEVSPEFSVLRIYGAYHAYGPVIARFSDTEPFSYNFARDYNSQGEERRQNIHEDQVPFTLHVIPDTLPGHKPAFSMMLNLQKRASYTFIAGGPIASMDTMFFKDSPLPYFGVGDSACAIRFINFIQGGPVKIIQKGATDNVIAANLPYKGLVDFITIPVNRSIEYLTFEMRDAATDELLATWSKEVWPLVGSQQYLYRVYSVLLKGARGTTGYSEPEFAFSRLY